MLNSLTQLWNSLEDIDNFEPQDLYLQDIVHFTAYHDADENGYGVISRFLDWEYFNEDKGIFETLPSVIVKSVLPDEQWVDYVPLTHLTDVYELNELLEEYCPNETNTDTLQALRVYINDRVQASAQRHTVSNRNVSQVRRANNRFQMA